MTVTPLGRDQDCSLKIREPDVPAPWFLDPGGWSKTAAVRLYFIFPGICTLSLELFCYANAFKITSYLLFYHVQSNRFMLRSLIYLDLSFVHGDRYASICNLLHVDIQTMRTCGLLPGWYGLTSQDLLTALQMFQNPDQLQDNWLKDEASQTAPVKIGASS
ncbi:hypothetical protein STEG23_031115 [Scotinomys teguina]